MEREDLNAKQFAERVGISAGTLSNILGGRNNPSLDVMQSVLNSFRTISADWLILDSGPMYRAIGNGNDSAVIDDNKDAAMNGGHNALSAVHDSNALSLFTDSGTTRQSVQEGVGYSALNKGVDSNTGRGMNNNKNVSSFGSSKFVPLQEKRIEKIVIFYTDGTFEER